MFASNGVRGAIAISELLKWLLWIFGLVIIIIGIGFIAESITGNSEYIKNLFRFGK